MEEIVGNRQCGFRRYRSIADYTFCIRQILENKWHTMKQCIGNL